MFKIRNCDLSYTRSILMIVMLSSTTIGRSQDWIPVKEVRLNETITSVSVDSKEQFYVGLASGSLIRYATNGEEDQYFSLANNSPVTSVEAWNRLKVFCFFRDQQRLELLDRFTTTPRTVDLASLNVPLIWLVTPGVDNSLWVLTNGLRELRKYDDQNQNLILNVPLPLEIGLENPVFMRAFKNEIIILDREKGLFFFDQFGNWLGSSAVVGASCFHIQDDLVVTLTQGEVAWIDPYSFQVTKKIKAPAAAEAFRSVVMSGDMFVFFSENSFSIYSPE